MADQESGWKQWLGLSNNAWGVAGGLIFMLSWIAKIPWPAVLFFYGLASACIIFWITGHVTVSGKQRLESIGDGLRSIPPEESQRRIAELKAEIQKGRSKSSIEVTILEADVRALDSNTGWCFVHVKLHNNAEIACETPKEYTLILTIRIAPNTYQQYAVDRFLKMSDYHVSIYEPVVSYDTEGNPYDDETELDREYPLKDLRYDNRVLEKGKPTYGWLGFDLRVHSIPNWPYEDEYRGQRFKPVFSDEGDFVDEELEEVTERIYYTDNIQQITLQAIDAWNEPAEGHRLSPFGSTHRRIVQR